eukprot:scaffold64617_cov35-Tisochrysis_lutea.AAC.4
MMRARVRLPARKTNQPPSPRDRRRVVNTQPTKRDSDRARTNDVRETTSCTTEENHYHLSFCTLPHPQDESL